MINHSHIALLASYNAWMNIKLFEAASKLSAQELAQDRNAFFGSILGTLNHLIVADTIFAETICHAAFRTCRARSDSGAANTFVAGWDAVRRSGGMVRPSPDSG